MKKLSIYTLMLMILALISCGKETPFNPDPEPTEEGQLSKSALSLDILDASVVSSTKAATTDVNLNDFDVMIYQVGVNTPKFKYKYGEMPEIVTLMRGEYYVVAEYGSNVDKGWDAPYYKGESDNFLIKGGEITDDIGDIKCKLQNVKVSVDYGPILLDQVENPNVEIKVCAPANQDNIEGLVFGKNESRCGYFRYEQGVTLIAEFNGLIKGDPTPTQKISSITNLEGGKHYKITFKLHVIQEDPKGGIAPKMGVDASLVVTDVERNVDLKEDELLQDNERPSEGGDDPDDSGLEITAEAPIDLSAVNLVDKDSHVVLNITSQTGITKFQVNIISDDLAGLVPAVLDLVEPGDNLGLLQGLGLLPEGKTTVRAEKNVKFDVSGFMEMLCALGSGKEHTFRLTVGDSSGEVVKELKLKTK